MNEVNIEGLNLVNVHDESECVAPCVIHAPTDHHMRGWQLIWRSDRQIFERICPHGVGHPDPDQFAYWDREGLEFEGVHGCDGCCHPPKAMDSPYFEGDVRIDADPDTAPAAGD